MNKPVKVWFNRAGDSRVNFTDLLRTNADGVEVHVHATRPTVRPGAFGPALAKADSRADEPDWDTSDREYADWALRHAKDHSIDVLVPSCRMAALAAARDHFAAIGCTVLISPSPATCRMLDSKSDTYAYLGDTDAGVRVPVYRHVGRPSQLGTAYNDLVADGYTPVVKLDTGWSADSFRILVEDLPRGTDLVTKAPRPYVRVEDYQRALCTLADQGMMPPLIVMPYLEGPEISVDVLADTKGVPIVTVPRVKSADKVRLLDAAEEVTSMASRAVEELELPYLTNVQFRHHEGEPVLLEINPRPAAGSYQSALSGVNLLWEAVRLATGAAPRQLTPKLGVRYAVGQQAIRL